VRTKTEAAFGFLKEWIVLV